MNPELRPGGENPSDWVTYAQEMLAFALADEIESGEVTLGPADGEYGEVTVAAVRALQRREGLPETGVVDAATWEAMGAEIVESSDDDTSQSETSTSSDTSEDTSEDTGEDTTEDTSEDTTPSADGGEPAAAEPVNLRVPFELMLRWDETDLERMLRDFENMELANQPNAQLTFPEPVGRLFGNGGMRWLEWELRSNPTVYVEAATQAIIGWSNSQGLELGADNEIEAGVRFRGVDFFISGEFDARLYPMEQTGEISGSGQFGIRFHLDSIGR